MTTATAPRFPVVSRPTHTLISEQCKAEGFADRLRTTVLGETYNDSEASADSLHIFVPNCRESGPDRFSFTEVLPGEVMFCAWLGNMDDSTIELASIQASSALLDDLVARGSTFQFVAAPGTDREQRYRVARGGKLQKIGLGSSYSPFSLVKPSRVEAQPHFTPVITTKKHGHTTIKWVDEGQPTGETSRAKYVDLSRDYLLDLADIFYALSALDSESFALYGKVCGICGICGRALEDAASIKRGIGPTCWERTRKVSHG